MYHVLYTITPRQHFTKKTEDEPTKHLLCKGKEKGESVNIRMFVNKLSCLVIGNIVVYC